MKDATYKRYVLFVLMTLLAFNGVDGLALGLLLQNIKLDLHLSDTQLGLLGGIAFAVFYSLMGIPIARWADTGNRVTIIALTAALWSVLVALCGSAASFGQLLLIRVGVAVGEAGCMPPAQSLIPDYFTREERPRAVAIYMLGGSFSVVIGYFVAGWLNELFGWRVTFAILGSAGLLPAALAWLTLREPRLHTVPRPARVARHEPLPGRPPLREVCSILWGNITFRNLLLSFCVTAFFGNGIAQWLPAFFVRSFAVETGSLGTWFAIINGVSGLLGTYWGGQLATRYAPNNERLQLRGMALVYCGFGALQALLYLSSNRDLAFALMGLSTLGVTSAYGPLFATIQTLVPARMRAVSIAIVYLFANLIGMGLGPLAVGVLSDALRPTLGEESLRYALLALCPGFLWGAWHLWRASDTVTRDLQP